MYLELSHKVKSIFAPNGVTRLAEHRFIQGSTRYVTFVRITEERSGLRIGGPSNVAKAQNWIY